MKVRSLENNRHCITT